MPLSLAHYALQVARKLGTMSNELHQSADVAVDQLFLQPVRALMLQQSLHQHYVEKSMLQ